MPARTVDPIYVPLTVATPAGTTPAVPLVTLVAILHGTLEAVDIQIPPGHAGTTGIRLTLAGAVILPYSNPGQWIVGDNFKETFELGVEVDQGLRVQTYNTGTFAHSFLLRFRLRQVPVSTGIPVANIVPIIQGGNG